MTGRDGSFSQEIEMSNPYEPVESRQKGYVKRPFFLMNKIIIGFPFVLACVVFVFWLELFDEPLSPLARHWLTISEQQQANPDEAFLFLIGISAPQGEDVLTFGLARFQANREAMDAGEKLAELGERSLELPKKDPIYKVFSYGSVFETVVNAKHRWKPELENRRVLRERYLEFLKFDTMIAHPLAVYFDETFGLRYGGRLRLFQVLSEAEEGRKENALDMLMADISRLRLHMEGTNSDYYKFTLKALISDYLDVLSHIHSSGEVVAYSHIASLSAKERSLGKTMAANLKLRSNTIKAPIFRFESPPEGWLVKRLYMPNKFANRAVKIYQAITELSTLPADQFAAHFDAGNELVSVEGIGQTREGALALELIAPGIFSMTI